MFSPFLMRQTLGQDDMGRSVRPLSLVLLPGQEPTPRLISGVTGSIRKLETRRQGSSGTGIGPAPCSQNSQAHLTVFTGAANISDTNAAAPRTDREVVPDAALRPSTDNQDHHTGRGGEGNVQRAHKEGEDNTHKGLADKLKAKVLGVFKK